ncbi:hypothetical protein EJB05_28123, partial [Eragrostis curvula]
MTEATADIRAGCSRWCENSIRPCLVHDFFGLESGSPSEVDSDDGNVDASPVGESDDGVNLGAPATAHKARKAAECIRKLLNKGMSTDTFLGRLAGEVNKAIEEMVSFHGSLPAFRRAVVSYLREGGYNAAVCQTRWRGTQDVSAGNYEYIDVVTTASGKETAAGERYIVDVGFAMEFSVARSTAVYLMVLEALPTVLVARPKVVQQVVKVAAKAARRSLKSQGLTVPPWRKKRFMAAKWLGPHCRTPDTAMGSCVPSVAAGEAICRIVGFFLAPSEPPCLRRRYQCDAPRLQHRVSAQAYHSRVAASKFVKEAVIADDMHPLQRFQMRVTPTASRRAKRATAPLDAAARARIAVLPSSVDSSGSEHEAAALSSLVNEYLFEVDATVPAAAALTVDQDSDDEDDADKTAGSAAADDVVQEIRAILDLSTRSDELCRRLTADVVEAAKSLDDVRQNRSAFRRAVMSRLQDHGHDAGLCKLRWDKSSGMVAGNYEYIDVVVSAEKRRYIVDVGFAAEFEVARPTAEFDAVRAALPEVLAAPADDVRRIVKAASAAARRSLKSRGLSVPPWRKRRFMMAKWFGPYRRTVNPVPASVGAAAATVGCGDRPSVCGTVL